MFDLQTDEHNLFIAYHHWHPKSPIKLCLPHHQLIDQPLPHHLDDKINAGVSVVIETFIYVLSIASIFPFLYYMIRDFHVAKREEDISFYAGFVGCALLFGRFLTAIHWGIFADRYGRKPVMLISTMAVVIFNTMFGLSKTYWMALTSRFLLGALCGVLGPIRAYITEVSRREHQALGVSMISSAWGIGLVVGPALGGYLSQPTVKYPSTFSQDSIFGRFPYFLVSLVISVLSIFVFGVCFWLPETLHSHDAIEDNANFVSKDVEKSTGIEDESSNSWVSLMKNWPLMSVVIMFSVFQMHDMAFNEIFSLWAVSPRSLGGLGFLTSDVGNALAVTGISVLLCQSFLYPVVERALGPMTIARGATVLSIILLTSFPFIGNLTGTTLKVVIDLASALQNVLAVTVLTGMFLLQNRAVCQAQRGTANGISLCIVSFANAIGPAAAGSILSWAQSRPKSSFLPGGHMVFFILNVIKVVGLLMSFKPFYAKPVHEYD